MNDEKLLEVLSQLFKELRNFKYNGDETLFSGRLGVSLFYFFYSNIDKKNISEEIALKIFLEEQERLKRYQNSNNFAYQLQWFLWYSFYLNKNGFIHFGIENIDDIKLIIEGKFKNHFVDKNYDLFYGAIGTGLVLQYICERENFVNTFYNFFQSFKETHNDMTTWKRKTLTSGIEDYNYGLAHGIPSIILFLNKLYLLSPSKYIEQCILESSKHLVSVKQNVDEIGSFFPTTISKDYINQRSRLAWCYGDLGCGYSLLVSAQSLNNKELYSLAMEILKHSASRKDPKQNMVYDLGICHGSSGLVLFFDRLYRITNDEVFKEASNYWLDLTVNSILLSGGIANVKTWRADEFGGSYKDFGFLNGLTGIGLVLLSAVANIDTSWDECLLLR